MKRHPPTRATPSSFQPSLRPTQAPPLVMTSSANSDTYLQNLNATNNDSSIKKDGKSPMEDIQGPPTSGSIVLPASIPENQEIHHRSSMSKMGSAEDASARRATASECAGSTKKFKLAASRNHFYFVEAEKKDSFLENVRENFEYPHLDNHEVCTGSTDWFELSLKSKEFVGMLDAVEGIKTTRDCVQKDPHPSNLPDMYGLKEAKFSILHCVKRFERLKRSYKRRKEIEFRPAIDDLVALAFCHRLGAKHFNECEAELFLPAEPFTATADVAAFLPLADEWLLSLEKLDNSHVFCASIYGNGLLTFAVDAKATYTASDISGHQLAFYLCSAQNQRRALGFTNHIIYGLTLVGHMARFYISYWVKNTVFIAPTRHVFDLSSFHQHLELFIVTCKLAENFEKQLGEMECQWSDPSSGIAMKNKEATDKPWRREDKRAKSGSSKGTGRCTSGMSDEEMDAEVELLGGMASDCRGDSDFFEEDYFRSFETSKSFSTSDNDGDNETRVPLKTAILEEFTSTENATLPPLKDIGTWAQRIADEVECEIP